MFHSFAENLPSGQYSHPVHPDVCPIFSPNRDFFAFILHFFTSMDKDLKIIGLRVKGHPSHLLHHTFTFNG